MSRLNQTVPPCPREEEETPRESGKTYMIPNVTGPTEAVTIDPDICVGCNACVDICRVQTIMPNPVPGQPPVVVYPDECWYCACCVEACRTGALTMNLPINQRIFFKRKETGEIYRLGQSGAPMKSFFKPPLGHYDDFVPGLEDRTCAVVRDEGRYPWDKKFSRRDTPEGGEGE